MICTEFDWMKELVRLIWEAARQVWWCVRPSYWNLDEPKFRNNRRCTGSVSLSLPAKHRWIPNNHECSFYFILLVLLAMFHPRTMNYYPGTIPIQNETIQNETDIVQQTNILMYQYKYIKKYTNIPNIKNEATCLCNFYDREQLVINLWQLQPRILKQALPEKCVVLDGYPPKTFGHLMIR